MSIQFEITTPERIVYKENIESLTLPTQEGEITILPGHLPLVAILKSGVLTARQNGKEVLMAVSGGFVEVQPMAPEKGELRSRVVILADTAERAEELTLEAVEQARQRAQKLMAEKKGVDDVAYSAAAAALERELARLKVAHRHHSKRGPVISSGETEV